MLRILFALGLVFTLAPPARAQVQDLAFGGAIIVDSTTPVAVATLPVEGSGVRDVALTTHVYLEGSGFDGSTYTVGICRGTAGGELVGLGLWAPGDKTPAQQGTEADVVTVTGFDAAASLPQTYVVCVRKHEADAPAVTAYLHGFNADTAAPDTRLAGFSPSGVVAIQPIDSTTPFVVGGLQVDAGASSDVSLTAHVVLRGSDLGGGGAYEVGLCRGSAAGPLVGRAYWRPPVSAGSSEEVVSLTGFDPAQSGVQLYGICVRKVHSTAPDLGASYFGIHASVAPAGTTLAGTQSTGFSSATLASTTFVGLGSVVTSHPGPYDVRLTAHAYFEPPDFGPARYELGICRDSASGPQVGRTFWRPTRKTGDEDYIGDTVALTGYDAGRTGDTTYVLCGAKYDADAPDATVLMRGLVATVPEPGAAAAGAAAALALAGLRRRPRARRR